MLVMSKTFTLTYVRGCMNGCMCVCVCECLRKSLKDSPRQGKKPSNRKQAEAAGSGQAELKILKHCLTQRAPLEFHLPPARSHSYSHTHTGILSPAASWEKMRQLSPLEQSLAGSGNLLPATKLRSAGHLHFGLRCVCVCVYMFLFVRVSVCVNCKDALACTISYGLILLHFLFRH